MIFSGSMAFQSLAFSSEEVTKVADGTFTVKWEDPDGGPEESEVDPKDIRRDEGTWTSGDLPWEINGIIIFHR